MSTTTIVPEAFDLAMLRQRLRERRQLTPAVERAAAELVKAARSLRGWLLVHAAEADAALLAEARGELDVEPAHRHELLRVRAVCAQGGQR